MTINFSELLAFSKEFKRLARKYKSLTQDIKIFREIISVIPLGNSKHFNIITQTESVRIIKARFFCKYLKGSSLRVIYAYVEKKRRIEFIEIYFKGDKENEDKERIKNYLRVIN